jgi:hypothetical protein
LSFPRPPYFLIEASAPRAGKRSCSQIFWTASARRCGGAVRRFRKASISGLSSREKISRAAALPEAQPKARYRSATFRLRSRSRGGEVGHEPASGQPELRPGRVRRPPDLLELLLEPLERSHLLGDLPHQPAQKRLSEVGSH